MFWLEHTVRQSVALEQGSMLLAAQTVSWHTNTHKTHTPPPPAAHVLVGTTVLAKIRTEASPTLPKTTIPRDISVSDIMKRIQATSAFLHFYNILITI